MRPQSPWPKQRVQPAHRQQSWLHLRSGFEALLTVSSVQQALLGPGMRLWTPRSASPASLHAPGLRRRRTCPLQAQVLEKHHSDNSSLTTLSFLHLLVQRRQPSTVKVLRRC